MFKFQDLYYKLLLIHNFITISSSTFNQEDPLDFQEPFVSKYLNQAIFLNSNKYDKIFKCLSLSQKQQLY